MTGYCDWPRLTLSNIPELSPITWILLIRLVAAVLFCGLSLPIPDGRRVIEGQFRREVLPWVRVCSVRSVYILHSRTVCLGPPENRVCISMDVLRNAQAFQSMLVLYLPFCICILDCCISATFKGSISISTYAICVNTASICSSRGAVLTIKWQSDAHCRSGEKSKKSKELHFGKLIVVR